MAALSIVAAALKFVVQDRAGATLDAQGEIIDGVIILHSRGGARGAPNVRNTEYATALRLILERLARSRTALTGIWVDSDRVQSLPLAERLILQPDELLSDPQGAFSIASRRMGLVGSARVGSGGNRNKRIRIGFREELAAGDLLAAIGAVRADGPARNQDRLPAEMLERVTAEDIWFGIEAVRAGAPHRFGPSTTYDLLTDDDERLPPKAVFGLAASRRFGFDVGPEHFSAGWGQPCFRILQASGYRIVPKSGKPAETLLEQQRVWLEGEARLVRHRRRERGHGLASAKKAQFLRVHGRLFCERCGLDPVKSFGGPDGEACIEIHDASVRVADMQVGHRTVLEDLQCLCANCHRFVHRIEAGLSQDAAV